MNSTCIELRYPEPTETEPIPAVLTIAGSDSSGGAGIEADLKTFTAQKVYGLTCIVALTAQNTKGVKSIHRTPKSTVQDILDQNFDDFVLGYDKAPPLKAIKTGMLTLEAVEVIGKYIERINAAGIKIVTDPVMISTSGSSLFDEPGMKACINQVICHAYLTTPNFYEALSLLKLQTGKAASIEDYSCLDQVIELTIHLQKVLGCKNMLIKGGHIPWNCQTKQVFQQGENLEHKQIVDILYESEHDRVTIFKAKSIESKDSHGTGCTLSSAIAANLAKGQTLVNAVGLSIDYIRNGMVNMIHKLGRGNGPLNHLTPVETNVQRIIAKVGDEENVAKKILQESESFLEYFKSHPVIQPNWQKYTRHEFVKLLALNNLPFDRFLYFLKQDYYYLVNYAQIHGLSSSVAPSYHQTHTEALIIGEIVNEIERHKEKLSKNYDIVYERDIDLDIELSPGKACRDYCDYLIEIGRREDFLGIKTALAPCLHGYYEAGKWGVELRNHHDGSLNEVGTKQNSDVYDAWLGDYSSDWYLAAYEKGKSSLQELLHTNRITQARLDELVEIFNTVTKLEIGFWDEILNR